MVVPWYSSWSLSIRASSSYYTSNEQFETKHFLPFKTIPDNAQQLKLTCNQMFNFTYHKLVILCCFSWYIFLFLTRALFGFGFWWSWGLNLKVQSLKHGRHLHDHYAVSLISSCWLFLGELCAPTTTTPLLFDWLSNASCIDFSPSVWDSWGSVSLFPIGASGYTCTGHKQSGCDVTGARLRFVWLSRDHAQAVGFLCRVIRGPDFSLLFFCWPQCAAFQHDQGGLLPLPPSPAEDSSGSALDVTWE